MSMRVLRLLLALFSLLLLSAIPSGSTKAATVSLIISNPVCVQPSMDSGVCYINAIAAASGVDSSFSRLEVLVDGKLRLSMHGFFEPNAFLNPDMLGRGLAVACGGRNASGNPNFGKIYTLYVSATLANGTSTWGSSQVRCPFYEGTTFLPAIKRP